MRKTAKQVGDGVVLQNLASYVIYRLPEDFMMTSRDLAWLDKCNNFVYSPLGNVSVTNAVKRTLVRYPDMHDDPFELLIDAKICNVELNPI